MGPHRGHTLVAPSRTGLGLFAARAFRPGETIVPITGRIARADELWERRGTFADNCFRYGPETYLDPLDGPGRYLNHSCEPNAGIRKVRHRLYLFAAERIARGREITIDYSTIIADDDIWTMQCHCGAANCRGRVRRIRALPAALRAGYVERGMVPRYILEASARA